MTQIRIFKWKLVLNPIQGIEVPDYWEPIAVQMQHGKPCIWAKVGVDSDVSRNVLVRIVGTGQEFCDDGYDYFGTVQDGGFVWHVYLSTERELIE